MSNKQMLAAALGHDAVGELTEEECGELLVMVSEAASSRRAAMLAAIDEALCHFPRLLHGPARKILGF